MHVAITGHRPDKLGGYTIPNPTYNKVQGWIRDQLVQLQPTMFYTGMALGVDQWAAEICLELGLSYTAVIPFPEQSLPWGKEAREHYIKLLDKAAWLTFTSENYHRGVYQIRNKWLVNNCDLLLAVWDGSSGGTKNCHDYAVQQNRAIIRMDPTLLLKEDP